MVERADDRTLSQSARDICSVDTHTDTQVAEVVAPRASAIKRVPGLTSVTTVHSQCPVTEGSCSASRSAEVLSSLLCLGGHCLSRSRRWKCPCMLEALYYFRACKSPRRLGSIKRRRRRWRRRAGWG
ncbi:hypothetical protein SRHO_G00068410 [Serrasalmus rhombeus]